MARKTKMRTKIQRGFWKRYVRFRILAERGRSEEPLGIDLPSLAVGSEALNYRPIHFRYRADTPPDEQFESLMNYEILDYEYWFAQLWQDFLIEPTPYVVASAITYLGFILLLVQYYALMWQFICLLGQFVPWDENVGFS